MSRKLKYAFEFEDGKTWQYDLAFDKENNFIPRQEIAAKDWTKLEFQKCPHCPLKAEKTAQCPIARNLDQVVEDSKSTLSCTRAKVTVTSPERTYSKACDTQEGLRSLFGVVMSTSGCPHLDWLRPLARFHLPFADIDETLFRVLSLQLMEAFLSSDEQEKGTISKRIEDRYKQVERVNHAFINRIRSYCKADADKNAIAALDVFVQLFQYQSQGNFESLRPFFKKAPAKSGN
jgi:hypothetical protein